MCDRLDAAHGLGLRGETRRAARRGGSEQALRSDELSGGRRSSLRQAFRRSPGSPGVAGGGLRAGAAPRRRRPSPPSSWSPGANLTTQILKALLAHPRYQPILGYRQIGSTSFPSGHAAASLSIALALVLVAPRAWRVPAALVGAAFALCIGLSVLVVNHHYPSDVLGGWLVTGAWFFAVLAGLFTTQERSEKQLAHLKQA